MIINRYRNTLIELLRETQLLYADPWGESIKCLEIQQKLIEKMLYIESRIRQLKGENKRFRKYLGTKRSKLLVKEEAETAKKQIKRNQILVKEYQELLYLFKSIGDALAFIYIPRWDIKPMIFKEGPGHISGKVGFKLERQILNAVFQEGGVGILNDLTNCLRYRDLVVLQKGKPKLLLEVKSSSFQSARMLRQIMESENILDYLKHGETQREGYDIFRVDSHSPETYHLEAINQLIQEAQENEFGFMGVERGLYYYVETRVVPERIEQIMKSIGPNTMAFPLHIFKYNNLGYFPFPLSIYDSHALFQFYSGDLILIVLIDKNVIIEVLNSQNLVVDFQSDEDWAVSISPNSTGKENEFGPMKVGQFFWHRLPCEFMSLEWFLNEIIHSFKQFPPNRINVSNS